MGGVYTPTTRPGHRLPHAWVEHRGRRKSTLDLVGKGEFLLIVGSEDRGWAAAARQLAAERDLRLSVVAIGDAGDCVDIDRAWTTLREVTSNGAVLVRPDNHVAWRSVGAAANAKEVLLDVFRKVLMQDSAPTRRPRLATA